MDKTTRYIDSQYSDALRIEYHGSEGLPCHYPVPRSPDLLFYIQRNLNTDTVIYELNRNSQGEIITHRPIQTSWIKFSRNSEKIKLNYLQEQLAYGYRSSVISTHTYEIQIVSYPKFKIYLDQNSIGNYAAYCNLMGELCVLKNIYVYAEDHGAFTDVKYVDIFGLSMTSKIIKKRITI